MEEKENFHPKTDDRETANESFILLRHRKRIKKQVAQMLPITYCVQEL
jgi:hypothetical protein